MGSEYPFSFLHECGGPCCRKLYANCNLGAQIKVPVISILSGFFCWREVNRKINVYRFLMQIGSIKTSWVLAIHLEMTNLCGRANNNALRTYLSTFNCATKRRKTMFDRLLEIYLTVFEI